MCNDATLGVEKLPNIFLSSQHHPGDQKHPGTYHEPSKHLWSVHLLKELEWTSTSILPGLQKAWNQLWKKAVSIAQQTLLVPTEARPSLGQGPPVQLPALEATDAVCSILGVLSPAPQGWLPFWEGWDW